MKLSIKRLLPALIIPALLFSSGCSKSQEPPAPENEGGETEIIAPEPIYTADDKFTLVYEPDDGFSPFSCKTLENSEICSMLYESLFTVNEDFSFSPLLCESWETDDFLTWNFTLLPDVAMHDGSVLTAQDAVYSIQRAMNGKWSSRFKTLAGIEATGDLTFKLRLSRKDASLPALLDVPIVKSTGAGENGLLIGTGPYIFDDTGEEPVMRAFPGYRDYASLPTEAIYLASVNKRELSRAFTLREIDLLCEDPLGGSDVYGGHELRRVATTILQYVCFNTRSSIFEEDAVRRAFALAVDRNYLAETVMEGACQASPLVLSPSHYVYEDSWANKSEAGARNVSMALSSMGFRDADADGYIERPGPDGTYLDFSILFLVNSDNPYKTAVADEIAYVLRSAGIQVTVNALPYGEYAEAALYGVFDMCLAETRLPPNFDFSSLLGTDGSLNYGHYSNENTDAAIASFLASEGEEKETEARLLCRLIEYDAPIVPILYRDYYIHTWRGAVTGINPSISGIFTGMGNWTIK